VHGIGIRAIHRHKHAAHASLALIASALLTESPWSRSSPIGKSVVAIEDAPQPLPALVIDVLLTPKDSQDQDLLKEFSQTPNLDEDLSLADLLFPAR